jgi:hypothetical protein
MVWISQILSLGFPDLFLKFNDFYFDILFAPSRLNRPKSEIVMVEAEKDK